MPRTLAVCHSRSSGLRVIACKLLIIFSMRSLGSAAHAHTDALSDSPRAIRAQRKILDNIRPNAAAATPGTGYQDKPGIHPFIPCFVERLSKSAGRPSDIARPGSFPLRRFYIQISTLRREVIRNRYAEQG